MSDFSAAAPAAPASPTPAPAPASAPASASPSPSPSSGAPTPGPSAEPSRGGPGVDSSIVKVLDWDPFGPSDPPAPSPTPAPTPSDPSPAPAAATSSPAPAAPASPAAPAAPTVESLTQQLAEMRTQMAALRSPAPAAPQPGPTPEPVDDVPAYAFNLPPTIMAKIRSEDPEEARQGVNALLQGAHRAAHRLIVNQLRHETMNVIQNYVQQQFAMREAARSIVQDYYGKFSDHNKPELRPIVKQITDAYMNEMGNPAWSEAVRDQIGARVNAWLGQFRTPVPVAPQPAAPILTPPGSRPAAPTLTGMQAELDDFMKL